MNPQLAAEGLAVHQNGVYCTETPVGNIDSFR
jgi:hypothetical protein